MNFIGTPIAGNLTPAGLDASDKDALSRFGINLFFGDQDRRQRVAEFTVVGSHGRRLKFESGRVDGSDPSVVRTSANCHGLLT
jgi:hypothetical protein